MSHEDVTAILIQFAKYGLRKTSMEDIARASGLSRQTVYNRFGSKEGAFKWTLQTFIGQIFETARAELDPAIEAPEEALLAAYQRWIGDFVEILTNHDHGMEILDLAVQSSEDTTKDTEHAFAQAITDFFISSGLASSPQIASDMSYALSVAAKGVMLKSRTSAEFEENMRRVISVVAR
nr:TetR/AcrR family transcriptional regulator [Hyphomonas sp. Mor2]